MTHYNALTAPALFDRAEMESRIPSPPDCWTMADDQALMHGLTLGMKLGEIAALQGQTLAATQDRFLHLRRAAVGHGVFTVPAQRLLAAIIEDRAARPTNGDPHADAQRTDP